jgi:hypothetical protein
MHRTFKGRVLPYDDNARDSLATERRILSVPAGTVIPSRRVVHAVGERWVVGQGSSDFHGDEEMRGKYILHRVDDVAKVYTFAQALSGAAPYEMFAGRLWVKDKQEVESSSLYPSYSIYMAATERLSDPNWVASPNFDGNEANVLIFMHEKWHLVRNLIDTAGGFTMAVVDELPNPVLLDVDMTTTVYNRSVDRKVPTTTQIKGLCLRWQSSFTYLAAYSPKFVAGDCVLMVLKSQATPSAADTFGIKGRTMKVVTVLDHGLVWSVHLRHV